MKQKITKLLLRLALSIGFLSAVADRFGLWNSEVAVWGNWDNFLKYTAIINPWIPSSLIPAAGIIATAAEIIFAVFLLIGFKTEFFAKCSGILLLIFGLAMSFSIGIKAPLDYSVFSAAAAAFALSFISEKYLEIDILLNRNLHYHKVS